MQPGPLFQRPAGTLRRIALMLLAGMLASACATPFAGQWSQVVGEAATQHVAPGPGVDACRQALQAAPLPADSGALDAGKIHLVNWNARKTSMPGWRAEYDRVTRDRDLVLLQEAALRPDTINAIPVAPYWSFAPGYRSAGEITGVLTLSRARPLTQCSFTSIEPLLRTPKGTSITQYGLAGDHRSLVVVNVHAVNFSLGLSVFERQFERIADVLAVHKGPVILSGDFNTWRPGRQRIIDDLAAALELNPVTYAEDLRVRVFGQAIDHIYVRGLTTLASDTSDVTTSDHSPMTVTLAATPGVEAD